MIKANFLNVTSGVSRKTERPWYKIRVIVMVNNDTMATICEEFVDEELYEKARNCRPKQSIGLVAGVNSYGKLCIADIVTE